MSIPGIETEGKSLREQVLDNRATPPVVRLNEDNTVIPHSIPMEPVKMAKPKEKDDLPMDNPSMPSEVYSTIEVTLQVPTIGLLVQKYHDVIIEGMFVVFVVDNRWKWGNYYMPAVGNDGFSSPFRCTIDEEEMILQYFSVRFTDGNRTYIVMARRREE